MAIYRITLTATHFGMVHQNVLHFLAPDGNPTMDQAAASMRDVFLNAIKVIPTSQLTWNLIKVETVATGAPPAPVLLPVNIAGTTTTTNNANPVMCYVLLLKTANGTRHGRGRMYIGAVTPGAWTQGIFTASSINNVANIWNNTLKPAYGPPSSGLKWGLLRAGGSSADFISLTDVVLRPTAGVQRRRNYGVGV